MLSKTALIAGAVGVASLGLIGGGSYAAFTTSASVTQSICSGTLDLRLTNLTNGGSNYVDSDSGSTTLSLPSVSDLVPGDSFLDTVKISNNGTAPVRLATLTYSGGSLSGAGLALLDDLKVSASLTTSGTVSGIPSSIGPVGPAGAGGSTPNTTFNVPLPSARRRQSSSSRATRSRPRSPSSSSTTG